MRFLPSSYSDAYGEYGRFAKDPFQKDSGGKASAGVADVALKSALDSAKNLFSGSDVTNTKTLDSIAEKLSFYWHYYLNHCWTKAYPKRYMGAPYPGPWYLGMKDSFQFSGETRSGDNIYIASHHSQDRKNVWYIPSTQDKAPHLGTGRSSVSWKDYDARWQIHGKYWRDYDPLSNAGRDVSPEWADQTFEGLFNILKQQKALYTQGKVNLSAFWSCFEGHFAEVVRVVDAGLKAAQTAQVQQRERRAERAAKTGAAKAAEREEKRKAAQKAAQARLAASVYRREKAEAAAAQKAAQVPSAPPTSSSPTLSSELPAPRRKPKRRKQAIARKKKKQKKRNLTIVGGVGGVVLLGVLVMLMRGRRSSP
jgi:hypothetical protein